MTRLLLGFGGVLLLAVAALGVLWLAGQVLLGAGVLAVGTAGVLLRLLWFVVVAAALGGLTYFLANAWRPVTRTQQVRNLAQPTSSGQPAPSAQALATPEASLVISAVPRLEKALDKAEEPSQG